MKIKRKVWGTLRINPGPLGEKKECYLCASHYQLCQFSHFATRLEKGIWLILIVRAAKMDPATVWKVWIKADRPGCCQVGSLFFARPLCPLWRKLEAPRCLFGKPKFAKNFFDCFHAMLKTMMGFSANFSTFADLMIAGRKQNIKPVE